jgi:hypothetical protein
VLLLKGFSYNELRNLAGMRWLAIAFEEFLRQCHIGLGPSRLDIVEDDREAVAWSFPETDVSRDDRVEHPLSEERPDIPGNLLR